MWCYVISYWFVYDAIITVRIPFVSALTFFPFFNLNSNWKIMQIGIICHVSLKGKIFCIMIFKSTIKSSYNDTCALPLRYAMQRSLPLKSLNEWKCSNNSPLNLVFDLDAVHDATHLWVLPLINIFVERWCGFLSMTVNFDHLLSSRW